MTSDAVPPMPEFSFEQQLRPRAQTVANHTHGRSSSDSYSWKSFFHSRIIRIATKTSPIRGDSNAPPSAKRICVEPDRLHRAYLVKPRAIMPGAASAEVTWEADADTSAEMEDSPQSSKKSGGSPAETPSKGPRRSISMHFSSSTSWITKSGSIRRRKRGTPADDTGANQRHVSEPMPQLNHAQLRRKTAMEESNSRSGDPSRAESELAAIFQPPSHQRNTSSPLPPLSRLSSFHIDLSRLGSSSSGSPVKTDEAAAAVNFNATGTLRVNSNGSQTHTLDRASTVASSEYHRGFTSGDDDDTDFKTDTPFDSLRTAASGRRRPFDSPLESMFDESPPSTAGHNSKPKRLSIQEILGPSFDGGHKIMEEDEGLPTPVRAKRDDTEPHFRLTNTHDDNDGLRYAAPSPDFALASTDFGRLSLDDDDDLDWTRDDELPVYNSLSPPSSMNSRRGSPNLRMALASISGNSKSELHLQFDASSERPRSTVFDWAEPLHLDKLEGSGFSPRPKTVHGKQEMDVRGGRSASRKGPMVAHIRSQSVPVVPDPADTSKTTQKFGTWGLGTKNVSEDWDDDFEFEEEANAGPSEGQKAENRISMIVPASIQATQPTVKAHSGQIRELSLLVNDLKRLCRLGRDMEILNGSTSKLWREAEGIIALASPDEDEAEGSSRKTWSEEFDPGRVNGRFVDEGFDGGFLDRSREVSEQVKTAVVKGRPLARRRSVFSPDDDIFGNWPQSKDDAESPRTPRTPRTPIRKVDNEAYNPSSVARSLMESMQLRRRQPSDSDDDDESNGRLNFDTNSLKELVKRASDLRDALSDLIRRVDRITQSPAHTPRRNRSAKNGDDSPAFTRVFNDPASSPTRHLPHSRSSNSVLSAASISGPPSTNGLSQRMHMMTVS